MSRIGYQTGMMQGTVIVPHIESRRNVTEAKEILKMAGITRKLLNSLGIEQEKQEAIIEAHTELVNMLKEQISRSGDTADELERVKKELGETKESLKAANDKITAYEKDDYAGKYKLLNEEYEKYKSDIAAKETTAKSKTALNDYLISKGYSESAARLITNHSDYHTHIEYDDKGKAKNLGDILKDIQAERDFAVFTPKVTETRHIPETPPANTGEKAYKSRTEIEKMTDPAERQAEIKKAIQNGSPDYT